MKKSFKIMKLFDIDIEIHYSWIFVFLLLTWGLSTYFFPEENPGLTSGEYWSIGILSAVFLFTSVLIHELSHSLVAKHYKIGVKKITLFFFGGIANIEGEDKLTPKTEFLMAIAGPLASVVLGVLFLIVFKFSTIVYVQAVSRYLYFINFILAFFNMAPGYPLDGGRVLRSIIWGITGSIEKATKIASNGGKFIAGVLIVYGVFTFNLFMVGLGIFLYYIAGASYEQLILRDGLGKVKIKDVMVKKFRTVNPGLSIADLFQNYFLKYNVEGAIAAKDKEFFGLITISSLKGVPKKNWNKIKVKELMISGAKIVKVKENDSALAVLSSIGKSGIDLAIVMKNKKIIGIVNSSSLLRFVKLRKT